MESLEEFLKKQGRIFRTNPRETPVTNPGDIPHIISKEIHGVISRKVPRIILKGFYGEVH